MNGSEIAGAMISAKRDVDDALLEWRDAIHADAVADDDSRRAKARAYITNREAAPKATVAVLDAMVDLETAGVQKAARLAEGLKRSAAGAFDAKVRWLGTLQSLAAMNREEARLANFEPRETA